jgi:hypothetical protein
MRFCHLEHYKNQAAMWCWQNKLRIEWSTFKKFVDFELN